MKTIIFLFVLSGLIFASCSDPITYDVTIVRQVESDYPIADPIRNLFMAVTPSGDSVKVIVREDVVLNNRLPYKAKMEKNTIVRYGYVSATK